jgi:outer membrane receptor for ferrienterochelin and colicins
LIPLKGKTERPPAACSNPTHVKVSTPWRAEAAPTCKETKTAMHRVDLLFNRPPFAVTALVLALAATAAAAQTEPAPPAPVAPAPVETPAAAAAPGTAPAPLPLPVPAPAPVPEDRPVTAPAPPPRPAPLELERVVISATRHAMPLADTPAAVTVVDREAIEQRGADNVLEALRGETGIAVFTRTISGRKALALRGFDPKHTLFLVDGRRISASDGVIGHSDFQLDWVAMDEIERIEVVRGPLAALYGAEALGGVVQIFTRAPSDKLTGSVLLEGSRGEGSRGADGHRAAARISGPLLEGLTGALSLSESRRDDVPSALDPRVSDLEGRHKQEAAWRVRWAAAPGQALELEQRYGREERWATSVERSGLRRVYGSDTDLDRSHTALRWSADWAGAQAWHTDLRVYQSRLSMENSRTNGVAALRPNALRDRAVDMQFDGRPFDQHLVTGGLEWRDENLENQALPGGDSSASHRSVFLQDEFKPLRDFTLTTGLRHDNHERFGGAWSPRLYAVWRAQPEWVIKGGYSRGFKPPTLKQITPGYQEDEGPYTYLSDPELQPEKSHGVELGVVWDRRDAGAQLMVFDNRVKDLIMPVATGVTVPRTTFQFTNIDRAKLQGAELSGSLRFAAAWKIEANYQYLEAHDGNGQRLEKRPRHTLGAGLEWSAGPWRAGARVDSSAGQVIASTTVGQPPQEVPPLTFLGANVTRELGSGLRLSVGLHNITNVNPPERSRLYTAGEAPRTVRIALRGSW